MAAPILADLTGRRALVTGGSRGIGEALAKALADAGAAVAIAARDPKRLAETAARLGKGKPLATVAVDLADPQAARRMVAEAAQALGGIDILVNNAGGAVRGPLLELDPAAFGALMALNVTSYLTAAQAAVPGMLQRGWGRVVNVSSVYARVPARAMGAYAISKAAVDMLTRQMALEWAGTGVTANALGPVQILTDLARPSWENEDRRKLVTSQIPMGRWATTDDLIGPFLHLCSDASAMMTGQTMFVDGGRLLL